MSDETLNQSLDVRKDLVEFCVLLIRGVLLKCSRFLKRIQIVQAFIFYCPCKLDGVWNRNTCLCSKPQWKI